MIPKSYHPHAKFVKRRRANSIVFCVARLGVLTAIKFDRQALRRAIEIHDITGDRALAAKSKAIELLVPQKLPELLFSVGWLAPQERGRSSSIVNQGDAARSYGTSLHRDHAGASQEDSSVISDATDPYPDPPPEYQGRKKGVPRRGLAVGTDAKYSAAARGDVQTDLSGERMAVSEPAKATTAEEERLAADCRREANWKRWGPYLAERQWGTVREDYSANGDCWNYLPHDHARSRAYRWGEDGLLGICDRECRLCFALALWNGRDPILKERLFGLTGPEGNHGEDVKEQYFYIDSTPTHSYLKGLYKYPQAEFPYQSLVEVNRTRTRLDPEFEIADTGAFTQDRYFDVFAEYAKAAPDDILIRLTIANRGPSAAPLHLLPTLWFRNTWSWGVMEQDDQCRPRLTAEGPMAILAEHPTLGPFRLTADLHPVGTGDNGGSKPTQLFTENNTNTQRLFGAANVVPFVKDAFHECVIHGNDSACNCDCVGTKAAFWYQLQIPAGKQVDIRLRLCTVTNDPLQPLGPEFERTFARRIAEADQFYASKIVAVNDAERTIARQAYAGLLWTRQFYYYVVDRWLRGDPAQPTPPKSRKKGRNHDWRNLFARDVLSHAGQMGIPLVCRVGFGVSHDPASRTSTPNFAKEQLLPAPARMVHASQRPACRPTNSPSATSIRPCMPGPAGASIKSTGKRGKRDRLFLERVLSKAHDQLHLVGQSQRYRGQTSFGGGFLGLDNIGVFDRSAAAQRRPPRTSRRHRLDELLLRHHALHRPGAGRRRSRL